MALLGGFGQGSSGVTLSRNRRLWGINLKSNAPEEAVRMRMVQLRDDDEGAPQVGAAEARSLGERKPDP